MKHAKFLKSVAIISLGGTIAKGIGALYRIPLTGLIGGYGMGLYHMAYPLFCLILTFTSAGIPSALSRIVAREEACGKESGGTLRAAVRLFLPVGLAGSLLLCALAPFMGRMQGDRTLAACYYALSPAVFLVALISVLRGYFQGKNRMAPTAVSEIAEQVVKAAAGILLGYRFRGDPARAVPAVLFAVTLSEAAALFCLIGAGRGERRRTLPVRPASPYEILSATFPVTVTAALMPLSQTVDSVVIVRLLSRYTPRAVSLYGLFTGCALSVVHLPAAVCYGIAAASVPAVSRACARGNMEEGRARALYSLAACLLFSLPCAAGLFLFARPAVRILCGGISGEEGEILVRLVRLLSVSAVTVAAVDTLSACLTGMGRAKRAAFAMAAGVAAKLLLEILLVPLPALSVGGAAIAANVCYLVAFFLDLFYTVRKKERVYDHSRKSRDDAGGDDPAGKEGVIGGRRGIRAHRRNALGSDA